MTSSFVLTPRYDPDQSFLLTLAIEGMDPKDELIEDQRDSLILARERIVKLERRLERYREANLRLNRENEQYKVTLQMYIDRERDRNRMNCEWTEEDQARSQTNPSWRYIKPYFIVLQDHVGTQCELVNEGKGDNRTEMKKDVGVQCEILITPLRTSRPAPIKPSSSINSSRHSQDHTTPTPALRTNITPELMFPPLLNPSTTFTADSETASAQGSLPRQETNLHDRPRAEPCKNPNWRLSYVRTTTPKRSPTGPSSSGTSGIDIPRPRSVIPSLFDLKLKTPDGLRIETLNWLKEDARAGCWNCGSTGHYYQDCMKDNKAIFCYGCGEPGVRITGCPYCRKGD